MGATSSQPATDAHGRRTNPNPTDAMTDEGPAELTLRIELSDDDMDQLGHLNQARYHRFLGTTRGRLLASRVERGNSGAFVIARIELDHHREVLRTDGHVEAWARVVRVGEKSVTIENELRRPDGTLVASGLAIMVAWDEIGRCSRPLTDAERVALAGTRDMDTPAR